MGASGAELDALRAVAGLLRGAETKSLVVGLRAAILGVQQTREAVQQVREAVQQTREALVAIWRLA